jgi:hypothetical protein
MTQQNRFLRTALSAGVPFGVFMGGYYALQSGPVPGITGGALAGVLFGLGMAGIAEWQRKRMEVKGPDFEGSKVVFQGPANHRLGIEARGGWLILTESELVFRSHGKNLQNAMVRIPVGELTEATTYRSLGIVANGLRVGRTGGGHESFVVSERALWVERITGAIATREVAGPR